MFPSLCERSTNWCKDRHLQSLQIVTPTHLVSHPKSLVKYLYSTPDRSHRIQTTSWCILSRKYTASGHFLQPVNKLNLCVALLMNFDILPHSYSPRCWICIAALLFYGDANIFWYSCQGGSHRISTLEGRITSSVFTILFQILQHFIHGEQSDATPNKQ